MEGEKEIRKMKKEEQRRLKEQEKLLRKEERRRLKEEKRRLKEEKRAQKVLGPEYSERPEEREECVSRDEELEVLPNETPVQPSLDQGVEPLDESSEEGIPEAGGCIPIREGEGAGVAARKTEGEGWFARLRKGLSRSRLNLFQPLSRALAARRFDESFWEEVEEILIGADVGYEMTLELVERVRRRMGEEKVREPQEVLSLFKEEVAKVLDMGSNRLELAQEGPSVIMVVGVNGTGKTTTIAKLGHMLRKDGKKVILAAGDTFRAAGIEQLEVWGQRIGVHTVKHRQGADAAAVVHDAVEAALARDMDVVIVDTAGRLHTKSNLMEELKKIKRVASRSAPVTETLLVIDATTGQNGLIQAKQFQEAVDITGLVLTKLDGTAKGGIVVAIAHELGIPIKFIGVGEDLDDLHTFDPWEFSEALFS